MLSSLANFLINKKLAGKAVLRIVYLGKVVIGLLQVAALGIKQGQMVKIGVWAFLHELSIQRVAAQMLRQFRVVCAKHDNNFIMCSKVKDCFHIFQITRNFITVNEGAFYGFDPLDRHCPYRNF